MSNLVNHDIPLRICKLMNWVLEITVFAVVWFGYYRKFLYYKDDYKDALIIAMFALSYLIFGRIYEAFMVSLHRVSEMVFSQFLAAFISDFLMYLICLIILDRIPGAIPMILSLFIELLVSVIWSILANHWYYKTFHPVETVIIYDEREGLEKLLKDYSLEKKFHVIRKCQIQECLENLNGTMDLSKAVFLSGVHSHDRNIVLKYCVEHDIRVYVIPRVGDVLMSGAVKMHMFHLPMLRAERYHPTPEYLFLKRLFDLTVSFFALIVVSPIMVITAIAVKFYDGGPVFFRQERLTKDGKIFKVIKFRSMITDAEKNGKAVLSCKGDDRITPVGHIIRACRIDELPQLFNIIKGDMSIVGPRPERPEIAADYCREIPEFNLRLQAKAGLTGYAQVYGKYNTTPYDKLQMDLMYISHPSFLEDLRICFATVKILFMSDSTEGVEKGQETALNIHKNEAV